MMKENKDIPYIVYESTMARMDRIIKRLWIVIILLVVLLVGSNIGWIYYESQFEQVTETTQKVEQDAGNGTNNFIGGDVNDETSDNN